MRRETTREALDPQPPSHVLRLLQYYLVYACNIFWSLTSLRDFYSSTSNRAGETYELLFPALRKGYICTCGNFPLYRVHAGVASARNELHYML
ncbi:hypothetical protein VN97_g11559 [Penicillium thymicola]|uniref:Uncharacterized protein n=1 Tax=Penicillium thymicola TaxID=293382 RepID=A0AAI9T6Z8_PENTH|nr:hypothetical protein VN97_g11559 [Penicillium thymicola]